MLYQRGFSWPLGTHLPHLAAYLNDLDSTNYSQMSRNKELERGFLKECTLPPHQKQSLIPLPCFCFFVIFISTEMQNTEHSLLCLGQKTKMLLLHTEQCSPSVACLYIQSFAHPEPSNQHGTETEVGQHICK